VITAEDINIINQYAAEVKQQAGAIGLTIEYSSDPQAFAGFLGDQSETHGVSSIHDPRRSDILPREFAWLLAKHDGEGVCSHAIRLIVTDSLIEDIITHRLYCDIEVPDHWEDTEMYPEARDVQIAGRVAFGGGLWVHPDWRGRDLSGMLRKVLRVISIPRLNWDVYFSTYRNTANRREWAKGDGWNPIVIPLSRGYYPPYRKPLDVLLAGATREQTLGLLRAQASGERR
jgi:hypothetical protein